MLSLLMYLGSPQKKAIIPFYSPNLQSKPAMAVLISPWVTLISDLDKNTPSDYLDTKNLHQYALQYAGTGITVHDPLISPGKCKDKLWWKDAAPSKGFFITFGAEEVFAPEIEELIWLLKDCGIKTEWQEEEGGIRKFSPYSTSVLTSRAFGDFVFSDFKIGPSSNSEEHCPYNFTSLTSVPDAWPVASLFLSSTRHKRLRGLEDMVNQINDRMGSEKT